MLEVWLPLLICAALSGSWYHVLRLRERAVAHARQLCRHRNLQLLDDSVSLHRLRARWRRGTLHVMREYRFYTSSGGNDRQTASLTLLGDRVVSASLSERDGPGHDAPAPSLHVLHDALPSTDAETDSKVIPINRARRTLH
ncbi:MAG: DUF3301 domain-containing protein [Rhodanobacteraceae bacterium]